MMGKYVDADALKNEINKASVWTSLAVVEIIDKMVEGEMPEYAEWKDAYKKFVDWKEK